MKKKKEAKQDFLLEPFLEPVPVEYHDDFEQILSFTQKVGWPTFVNSTVAFTNFLVTMWQKRNPLQLIYKFLKTISSGQLAFHRPQ